MCVCVCVCVRACVRACACVCVCARVHMCINYSFKSMTMIGVEAIIDMSYFEMIPVDLLRLTLRVLSVTDSVAGAHTR